MKLRHVITAISGFGYLVDEYDVFPNGKVSKNRIEIGISDTSMRRLEHNLHHEKQVKGGWIILSEEEFKYQISAQVPSEIKPKLIVRKKDQSTKVIPRALDFLTRVIFTDHVYKRVTERFGLPKNDVRKFVTNLLDGNHFVVQNAEFYNTARKYKPTDAVICSLSLNALLIVTFSGGRYKLVSCYEARSSRWFQNWFQDHMTRLEELPRVEQYFHFQSN